MGVRFSPLAPPFGDQKTRPYIGRISTVERELGSQRIATFTESNHDPSCYVGDPALLCTATGGVEQTPYHKLDRVNSLGGSRFLRSSSSFGRAPRCQRGGGRFKPCLLLQQYLDASRQISTEVLFPNKGIAQGITYIGPSGGAFCRRTNPSRVFLISNMLEVPARELFL